MDGSESMDLESCKKNQSNKRVGYDISPEIVSRFNDVCAERKLFKAKVVELLMLEFIESHTSGGTTSRRDQTEAGEFNSTEGRSFLCKGCKKPMTGRLFQGLCSPCFEHLLNSTPEGKDSRG